MLTGICGRILRVDLSSRRVWFEEPGEKFYRTYFGGTGFTAYYLLTETEPGIDPLSPNNRLVFSSGPITGALFPGAGRHGIGAKSPLTGGFGDAQAGGFWGKQLKAAGFDAIVVEGASQEPVFIYVHDEKVEIRDARSLWGLTGKHCIEEIKNEVGGDGLHVAYIGQAGENLVRYACIGHDLRAFAGRCGLGAVMGSKRLKAVAVKGSKRLQVFNHERIRELTRSLASTQLNSAGMRSLHEYGTSRGLPGISETGGLPTRNFRQGSFENVGAITGKVVNETIVKGKERCFACPIACKRIVEAGEPYPISREYGGPEYETIGALGSCCGISNLGAIARANQLCSDYGLDTISTGVTIAFAMECFEEGILTKDDTDGLELRFGNADVMLEVIELIAFKKGYLGNLLAEGSLKAAEALGCDSRKYAIQVKGLEVPMHEPRLNWGLGVGYAVSPTGADHCHNFYDMRYCYEPHIEKWKALGLLEPVEHRDLGRDKISFASRVINWNHFVNSAIFCQFIPWSIVDLVDLVTACTGWNTTAYELLKVGERACTLARVYNLREGFTHNDDALPDRFFEAFTSGPLEGVSIDKDEFNQAIKYYYESMGWDEDGVPTTFKLHELGIPWAKAHIGK